MPGSGKSIGIVLAVLVLGGLAWVGLSRRDVAESPARIADVRPDPGTPAAPATANPVPSATAVVAATPAPAAAHAGPMPSPHSFKALDLDANRSISPAEARAFARLSAEFARVDANGDGKLSRNEYSKFQAFLERSSAATYQAAPDSP